MVEMASSKFRRNSTGAFPPANGSLIAFLLPLSLSMTSCEGPQAPTTDDIRAAYAAHLKGDPAHAVGLAAKSPPAVIPNQQPRCASDGNGHFDCEISVFYELDGGGRNKRSARHALHIRKVGPVWVIDSLN